MLHFEGSKDFSRPAADVWAKLGDLGFLVQCIPGVESVDRPEAGVAVCVLRPGFAFARGTLEVTIRLADAVAEQSLRMLLHSKGIGTTSDVEAALTFAAAAAGSQVNWVVDVMQLGGLLKAVPQGLLRAAAQKVIADAWTTVEEKMSADG